MKERIRHYFSELSTRIGVSGYEQDVARYCRDTLSRYADEVEVMPMGNVIGTFRGSKPGPTVMVAAHMDEVGIIVRYILPNGFLLFEKVGAVVPKVLPGRRMLLRGDRGVVHALVGITPGHLTPPSEANTVPSTAQSYLDIGASSRAEAEAMGIRIGTTGVYDCPVMELNKPDLLTGRCVDDRIGCAVLLALAETLKKEELAGTVHLAFVVQEETSHAGAAATSAYLKPDYCITLDTFPAGGTPDAPETRIPANIGKGVVMSLYEAINFAFLMYAPHPRLVEMAKAVAESVQTPLQWVTMAEALYCNDASDVIRIGSHCPCLELGIPRRYSHSMAELFCLDDAVSAEKLIAGMLAHNDQVTLNFLTD